MHVEDYGKASTYGLKRERERLLAKLGRLDDSGAANLFFRLEQINDVLDRREAEEPHTSVAALAMKFNGSRK
jgi:hypothetical protein